MLDAYCGVGIIGMLAARQAGHVTGIELVPDAVACARKAALRNEITNIDFICGDTAQALKKGALKPSVVFMDPPRAGCSQAFLDSVSGCSPRRVVYISCNPSTLRRDVDILQNLDYRVESARPFDLFPYTGHVECVVLMSRVKA